MLTELLSQSELMVQKNVFGRPLLACSTNPMTGFFRNGCCETDSQDRGMHTVCALVTAEFLEFSKRVGNDLSTPTSYFPGLKPGNKWCLCAGRWLEAYAAGCAPQVYLERCHLQSLELIPFDILEQFGVAEED
jgi:uncharacterized protein